MSHGVSEDSEVYHDAHMEYVIFNSAWRCWTKGNNECDSTYSYPSQQ